MVKLSSSPSFPSTRRKALAALGAAAAAPFLALVWPSAEVSAQVPLSQAALIGTWQGVERTGAISILGQVTFFPNGTYQRHHVLGALQTLDNGNYAVVQNWVHFYVMDYQPKEYNGRRMAPPPTDTWVLSAFDGRTLAGTIGGATVVQYQKMN
jgi:hypothetical protein